MPITDVVFDYCGVLLDWRPELTMEGKVDTSTMRRLLDHADPYGFWHYDLMSDLGWSEEQVLRDFARHHPHDGALNHAWLLYTSNATVHAVMSPSSATMMANAVHPGWPSPCSPVNLKVK